MVLKIINIGLILFTTFMGLKHGWSALNPTPENMEIFSDMHLSKLFIKIIGVLTIAGALMILFPATFFWGNWLNAALIVCMIMLFIQTNNIKYVLIEIPFLLIPFIILSLKYPLAK